MTTVQKLPALAKKGLTQAEAARKLGVSRQRVSQLVAKLGLKFRTYARPVKTGRLAALAKRGLTQTETARQLGVSQQRVSKLASELGISFSPMSMRPRPPRTKLGKVMQGARMAHGYSYTKLAALSGLDRHHITAIEMGRVRHPTARTLRSLAKCLRPHTSYAELVQAAEEKASAGGRAARRKTRRASSRPRKAKR